MTKISKNTTTTISCTIHGQPGTKYQIEWKKQRINNNSYYLITIDERKITDLNISYTINLTISNNISAYFIANNEVNCTVAEEKVNCFISYTCAGYYIDNERIEKEITINFTGYGKIKFTFFYCMYIQLQNYRIMCIKAVKKQDK